MTCRLGWTVDVAVEVGPVIEALSSIGVTAERAGSLSIETLAGALEDGSIHAALAPADQMNRPELAHVRFTVLRREEPRDVVIPGKGRPKTLRDLPPGSRVGVAGARRTGFLRAHRPDLIAVSSWNGSGPVGALRSGAVDALVVGAREARGLGLTDEVTEMIEVKAWLPGPAQGAVALVTRDGPAPPPWSPLDHAPTRGALAAERAMVEALEGTASAAVGVLGMPHGLHVRLWGMIASVDGRRVVRGDATGRLDDPEAIGRRLARVLVDRGAASVLGGSRP